MYANRWILPPTQHLGEYTYGIVGRQHKGEVGVEGTRMVEYSVDVTCGSTLSMYRVKIRGRGW